MNRWSSHRIARQCSEHRCKGFRRGSGVNLAFEGAPRRTALSAGSESRRRSGYELELRLRRGPRRRHRRQPYALQIGPDRARIGQGGDDPQAPATGRAGAEVGGKHPRQQGRPPQPMGAGRSARSAVHRKDQQTSEEPLSNNYPDLNYPTELYDLEKDLANRFAHSTETNFRQSGFIAIYSSSRMSFIGLLTAALTAWNATGKKATAIPKRMAPMVNCDQTRLTCPPQVQIRQ